ncbi:MAG: hypothetical protein O8C63_09630 [Candidatus Methanoperedens sp.]|nr:hypothetical protein [Candidatus Methanoperedens sp.]
MFNMEDIFRLRAFLRENQLKSSLPAGQENETWTLTKIGLSPTEASIYLELLNNKSTAVEMAEALENSKYSASTLMKKMLDKGFVYRVQEGKNFAYHAVDPDKIADIAEDVFREVGTILKTELRRLKNESNRDSFK